MKIAILDDELHCVESLVSDMHRLFPNLPITYKSTKPLEAVEVLKRIDIDLLFLDVEMPQMNGFDFLGQFEEMPFDVIFTTAYSQYAIKAFEAQAIDYLLKPIDVHELEETVSQYMYKENTSINPSKDVTPLLAFLKKEGLLKNKLAIPTSDGMEFIEITCIVYCHAKGNQTLIYTNEGKSLLVSTVLNDVEKSLNKFMFVRVHPFFLVNPNYIKRYIRNDGGYLVLVNGEQIPVSSSKQEAIIDVFERLKENK